MREICLNQLQSLLEKNTVGQTADILGVGYNTVIRRAKKYDLAISRLSPEIRRLPLELNDFQKNLVVGTMLGDACLYRKKTSKSFTSLYRFGQCLKRKEYVDFISKKMKPFSCDVKLDDKKWFFYTRTCMLFGELHNKWYLNDVKIVPHDISINEEVLYFWYLDDGSHAPREICLHTNGFTKDESQLLCDYLWRDLSIRATVQKAVYPDYGEYNYIRIRSKSYLDFMGIINSAGPVIQCFDYKFNIQNKRKKYVPNIESEKAKHVMELYKCGKKIKDICCETSLSLSTIERVIYGQSDFRRNSIKEQLCHRSQIS